MPKRLIMTLIILFFATLLTITLFAKGCSPVPTLKEKEPIIYPTRPVTMIVPFVPGGALDLQARSLEALFNKYFGQNLIVTNKPGGSGIIGWNELVASEPDGYMLGIGNSGLIIHSFFGDKKYHYPTALDPIAQLATSPVVLVVNETSPVKTVNELITYAKENSSYLKLGHPGTSTPNYLLGKVLERKANINIDYVPFKGGSEIMASLLGNHIQVAYLDPSTVKEQLRAGKIRALATTGEKRLTEPILSAIPTLKELGIDIVLTNWHCVVSPKPLPPEVKEQLDKGFAKMVADPDFKRNMESLGLEIDYLNAADAQRKWVDETYKMEKWLKETGVLEEAEKEKS